MIVGDLNPIQSVDTALFTLAARPAKRPRKWSYTHTK